MRLWAVDARDEEVVVVARGRQYKVDGRAVEAFSPFFEGGVVLLAAVFGGGDGVFVGEDGAAEDGEVVGCGFGHGGSAEVEGVLLVDAVSAFGLR